MGTEEKPHVVIIGGGFGGLYAAQSLKRVPVRVTLLDRRNFHLFQPLLYQVATGSLSAANIAAPLRAVLRRQNNIEVWLAEVTHIDVTSQHVVLHDGERIAYDTLIVATGSRHSYFGHDEWQPFAPGLKTIEDATTIRRRLLFAFEAAERASDAAQRQTWLTFAIVGGGPTGVELAGALAEIARDTLRHDFRHLNPKEARILLLEGTDRILPPYPPSLSAKAADALHRLGVNVRTGTLVVDVQPTVITVCCNDHEEHIPTRTVVWAAGVQASPLGQGLATATGASIDRAGRVEVQPDLSLPGHPDIFVIGDLAHYRHQTGIPLPAMAPGAMQQGRYVARLIQRRLRGQTMPPFHYRDRGNMAIIGRGKAVAALGPLRFAGCIAWLAWLFIHLLYLVEFQNRLLVLIQWASNYFSRNWAARLITGDEALLLRSLNFSEFVEGQSGPDT